MITDLDELTANLSHPFKSNVLLGRASIREESVPDLVFDISSEYWDQYAPGDTKSFELRFGGLGFYQVNMVPVYAEQRAFYNSQ